MLSVSHFTCSMASSSTDPLLPTSLPKADVVRQLRVEEHVGGDTVLKATLHVWYLTDGQLLWVLPDLLWAIHSADCKEASWQVSQCISHKRVLWTDLCTLLGVDF